MSGVNKPLQFCCVAIGSRDRSLSVWSTSLKRPLVVIHELFVSSVLDISWSSCGMRLCACSKDGTIVFIEFTEQELGQPLDNAQLINVQERLYGKLMQGGCTIMESPELLKLVKSPPPAPAAETVPEQPPPPPPTVTTANSTPIINSATPTKAPINKQIETRTSDGKRRITPMFIPPPPETMDSGSCKSVPTAPLTSFSTSSPTKSSIIIEKRDEIVQPNISSNINLNATSSTAAQLLTLKRKEPNSQKANSVSPNKKTKVATDKPGNAVLFPPLKPSGSLSQQSGLYSVSVTSEQNLYHLQVFQGTNVEPLWDHYLGYSTTGLATSPSIVAVSLEDGSVHTFYTAKGARATPPLVPPSPIAKLHAAGSMVMVISCYGDVRVWEITVNSCRLVVSTHAGHLVTPGAALLSCTLFNGMPHLAFSNARAYIYHKEMGTWLLIGDSLDPVWRSSSISSVSPVNIRQPKGPLAVLQEGLNRISGTLPPCRTAHSASCIISYLEQQVLASKAVGSPQEYVHWLLAFVSFLCAHDVLESRLRIILDELMGPSHSSANKSAWDPMILGHKKHKLLEDVLKILSTHLRWQRLYLEYNEQLEDIKQL